MTSSKYNVEVILNIALPMPMCMAMWISMSGATALRGILFKRWNS